MTGSDSVVDEMVEISSDDMSPQVLKGYVSVSDSFIKKQSFQLTSLEHINPELMLEGDRAFFKAGDQMQTAFQLPLGTFIESTVNHISGDQIIFKVEGLLLADKSRLDASGLFKVDLKKQDHKNIEQRIGEHGLLRTGSNVLVSSLAGTIKTLEYGGLPLILLSDGVSAIAGAGLGAVFGALNSFVAVNPIREALPSGSLLKVQFLEPLQTEAIFNTAEYEAGTEVLEPCVNSESINLNVKLNKSKKFYSYNFGESLLLELTINNASDFDFDLQDFVLVDKANSQTFLPNPLLFDFNTAELSELNADSTKTLKLCYSLGKFSDDLSNYKLQILDPISSKHLYYLPIEIF